MEGKPSWAMTLPSQNSTKACTMLCGWTTTSSASYGRAEQVVRLDQLERLVGQRRAVHRDLGAHAPGRVASASSTVACRTRSGRPLAEGPARAGEDQPRQTGVAPGDALEHRAVLRVHRHDLAAAGARGLRHQVAGHDQGFLVGQRHPLPGPERGERGVEPGRADDRVDHDVHVGVGRGLDQHLGPGGLARSPSHAREAGEGRPPLRHLRVELLAVPARRSGPRGGSARAGAAAREGAPADRAGRAQDGHARVESPASRSSDDPEQRGTSPPPRE